MLDEREFELVNIIGAQLANSQRDLSRHMELSLGQTNMLIRRLISKGYIRITQLNQKKVKYLLTPKGLAEKMKKSVKYTMKTISSIGYIKERVTKVITGLYAQGHRVFYVLGSSDFSVLVELAARGILKGEGKVEHIDHLPKAKLPGVILICKENTPKPAGNGMQYFNLIEELAKDSELVFKNNHVYG